jgi:hypothetical protein
MDILSIMDSVLNTNISLFYYWTINQFFEKFQEKKLAMNWTAMTHAVNTSFLGLLYYLNYHNNITLLKTNSYGYFIFDFFYLLKNRKIDVLRSMYLYHHIAALYFMSLNYKTFDWISVLFWGEVSNIPNYIVYYYKKLDEKKQLWKGYESVQTKVWKKIQLYTYIGIRVGIFSLMMVNFIKNYKNKFPLYVITPVYLMGLGWTFAMYKQNK